MAPCFPHHFWHAFLIAFWAISAALGLPFPSAPFGHFDRFWVPFSLYQGSILVHFSILFPDLDLASIFDRLWLDF